MEQGRKPDSGEAVLRYPVIPAERIASGTSPIELAAVGAYPHAFGVARRRQPDIREEILTCLEMAHR